MSRETQRSDKEALLSDIKTKEQDLTELSKTLTRKCFELEKIQNHQIDTNTMLSKVTSLLLEKCETGLYQSKGLQSAQDPHSVCLPPSLSLPLSLSMPMDKIKAISHCRKFIRKVGGSFASLPRMDSTCTWKTDTTIIMRQSTVSPL